VEVDLSRYHQIDYRDRWRFDENGARKLTLRMIAVRVKHLPADSATAKATGGTGWTLTDHLLADVFHATGGNPHPWKPKQAKGSDPERAKRVRAAKARARERQRAIDAGEIT
jgi:hypothetical protein